MENCQNYLKCDAGEGWRRSEELIVSEMENYYLKARNKKVRKIKRKKADRIGHILRKNCLVKHVMEGRM